jgi:beta-glucanase (GH16 family)
MSGMLQTWNKLCFNGGAYFEVSMSMPGNPRASGYWPGAWTMGNLGRAGFGATNDGMWRESCLLPMTLAAFNDASTLT